MPKFAVEVSTTIAREVIVEAASTQEAEDIVRDRMADGNRFFPELPMPWNYSEAYDVDHFDVLCEVADDTPVAPGEEF